MNNINQNRGKGYNENSQGRQNGNNPGRGYDNSPITLPDGYLINGYYIDAEKEKRDPRYIIDFAQKIAGNLEREGKGQKNTSTQIRKYFDYGLRIQDKLQGKKNDFTYIEADIAQFVSTVAYAKGRGVVTNIFEQFLVKNVEKIKDAKDYYAFMKHFEAVIAYMKK